MTAIEQHYIKGMTVKLFVTIILSTATICSTVIGVYYKLSSDTSTARKQSEQALQETADLRRSDTVQNSNILNLQGNQRMLIFQMNELYSKPR
jgi:uncharacterized protein YpmB